MRLGWNAGKRMLDLASRQTLPFKPGILPIR